MTSNGPTERSGYQWKSYLDMPLKHVEHHWQEIHRKNQAPKKFHPSKSEVKLKMLLNLFYLCCVFAVVSYLKHP